jgi:hypothetical protein
LAVIRSRVIKSGKKFKYKYGELFKPAHKELYQVNSDTELLEKWMRYWNSHITPLDGVKINLSYTMEAMLEEFEVRQNLYSRKCPGRYRDGEREITAP